MNVTPGFGGHHPDGFSTLANQGANMSLLHPHLPRLATSRCWQRLSHSAPTTTTTLSSLFLIRKACNLLIDETLRCVEVALDVFNAGEDGITVACFLGVLIHFDVGVGSLLDLIDRSPHFAQNSANTMLRHLHLALARSHHRLRRKFGDCELVPEPIRDSCCSQGIFLVPSRLLSLGFFRW